VKYELEAAPICPHCGHEETDAWEIDFGPGLEGDATASCDSCGEDYFVTREVTVYYSTDFIKEKAVKEERKHIGYIERDEGFYNLYEPTKDAVVTNAFVLCKYCDGNIYHCMGPKSDAVCFDCYNKDPELR
jgi:transcription elongation factor Elf1